VTAEVVVIGGQAVPRGVWLRSAVAPDQELLRGWRNANQDAFFQRSHIAPEAQDRWFAGYLLRPDDFLFIVMYDTIPCGCLGVRLREEGWDVYNVIRGTRSAGSRGAMGEGLELLVAFARARREGPIRAEVLQGNPAVAWYSRNGFEVLERGTMSVTMRWVDKPESRGQG